MYYKLKSEIVFKGFTMKSLSAACGIPYPSWLRKMKDHSFTLDEAITIKSVLQSDLLIEDLFVWEDR